MIIQLSRINPNKLYQLSGENLLNVLRMVAKETVTAYKQEQEAPDAKHKYSTEDAAAYLGVKKSTMAHFNIKYKMEFEKGRPNYYTLAELQRVERERRIKPF